jgi:hypothetical protein
VKVGCLRTSPSSQIDVVGIVRLCSAVCGRRSRMVLAPHQPSLQLMIFRRGELGAAKSWIRGEHEAAIKIIRARQGLGLSNRYPPSDCMRCCGPTGAWHSLRPPQSEGQMCCLMLAHPRDCALCRRIVVGDCYRHANGKGPICAEKPPQGDSRSIAALHLLGRSVLFIALSREFVKGAVWEVTL